MIRVAGLTYRYPGSTHDAVQGVEFSVRRGEIFGFLGPSGAGKSTIQKILIGVLREYQGTVEVMGRDLPSYGREYYRHVGVSFELPNLYARFTALENLDFFSQLYDKPTKDPLQLLRLVGLEGDAHTRVGEFSKGMKMRLNFCRALLHDPEILFLDEPTSGLDPASARRIMEMIREQKDHGKTVFLTTHNMTVADHLCDRVAFIVDGRIRLVDAPRRLKLRHGRRQVRVECRQEGSTVTHEFPLAGIGENQGFLALLSLQDHRSHHLYSGALLRLHPPGRPRKIPLPCDDPMGAGFRAGRPGCGLLSCRLCREQGNGPGAGQGVRAPAGLSHPGLPPHGSLVVDHGSHPDVLAFRPCCHPGGRFPPGVALPGGGDSLSARPAGGADPAI